MSVSIGERAAIEELMAGSRFQPCPECRSPRLYWSLGRPDGGAFWHVREIQWSCRHCGNGWAETLLESRADNRSRDSAPGG